MQFLSFIGKGKNSENISFPNEIEKCGNTMCDSLEEEK